MLFVAFGAEQKQKNAQNFGEKVVWNDWNKYMPCWKQRTTVDEWEKTKSATKHNHTNVDIHDVYGQDNENATLYCKTQETE